MAVIEWTVCKKCAAYTIGTAHTVTYALDRYQNRRPELKCNECGRITYPDAAIFFALHPTVKDRLDAE